MFIEWLIHSGACSIGGIDSGAQQIYRELEESSEIQQRLLFAEWDRTRQIGGRTCQNTCWEAFSTVEPTRILILLRLAPVVGYESFKG